MGTGSVNALVAEGRAAFEQGDAESSRRAHGPTWAAEGKLRSPVDVVEGLENAPAALNRLFTGQNLGKQLVKIADASFD